MLATRIASISSETSRLDVASFPSGIYIVTIQLEGRWDGKQVQVVGSMPIAFDDYGVSAPSAPAVASVDDHGEMELQLFFDPS